MMETFENLLYQLHLSYLHARKNKRNTQNQLAFELDQETQLYELAQAIYHRQYVPKPSIAFIIRKPVMREIFAADFSDRIIHHLIYRCIYPIIDRKLIHDTYSCRVGKGTLYGIERAQKFIRSCTENYQHKAYILKVDIRAYFMNMQHQRIYDKVVEMLPRDRSHFLGISRETIDYLLRQTIFHKVAANCRVRGSRGDWKDLPPDKSLFSYPETTGLPIGNLTSQVFGNVYLNDLDHFVKKTLKIRYYGRYVDDMLFVHREREALCAILPALMEKAREAGLTIHPKKILIKPAEEGVYFLGQILKPFRRTISNRTKNHFYQAIQRMNKELQEPYHVSWEMLCEMRAVLNSYLGCMQHANTYRLRRAMLSRLSGRFYDFFKVNDNLSKVSINEKFWQWHHSVNYRYTR